MDHRERRGRRERGERKASESPIRIPSQVVSVPAGWEVGGFVFTALLSFAVSDPDYRGRQYSELALARNSRAWMRTLK